VRLDRRWLILIVVAVAPLLAACPSSAPRKRPVKMGDVNTGPGSLEAVRRQLQGTWELVEAVALDAKGTPTPRKAEGRLTYDEYGNLTIAAKLADTTQPPSSVSGLLAYTGRAVIDPAKSQLVLMDLKTRLPSGEPIPSEVSPDKVRLYTIEGDTLTLTSKDSSGVATARTTWRKVH
jgi:hypothetical protein